MQGVEQATATRLVEHIRNGTTDLSAHDLHVPIAHFSDHAHAAREVEALRRQFLIIAHASELPAPGHFITCDALGTALLILRQPNGQVAAFLNMCRHRGGKVELAESGKKRFFVCSYHGWSYGETGALRGVPFAESYDSIEKGCRDLIPVACAEHHGLIWICLEPQAGQNIRDFLGTDADAHVAAFEIDQKTIFRTEILDLAINWKLIMDGASDIMHPQFLHANTVGKLLSTGVSVWKPLGRHGQSYSPRRRLLDCVRDSAPYDLDWRHFGANMYVWPNAMIIPTPDHIEFWTVWPSTKATDQAQVRINFLVNPDKLDEKVAGRINRSWEILKEAAMTEDFPMEETIQANATANPYGSFIYGRSEISIQQLHREMAKELASLDSASHA